MTTQKKIEDIKVGDSVVEKDGYALEVVEVIPGDEQITLFLKSMMGPVKGFQTYRGRLINVVGV